MKSVKEQKEDQKIEELAKFLFDDDRVWPHMSEITREGWRKIVKRLLRHYKVERKYGSKEIN